MKLQAERITAPNEPAYALMAQIHRRAFEPQGDRIWKADAFRQLVESPGMQAAVFHLDNMPVALCLYRIVAGEAELITIAVDPACRGRGYAREILHYLEQELRLHGVETMFLEVRSDNLAAIAIYERFGVEDIGVRPNYYQNKNGKKIDARLFSLNVKQ